MTEPTLLVHVCCGVCVAALLEPLRRLGAPVLYFHNPNIQPLIEFRRRLKAAQTLAEREGLDLVADARYDPKAFLRAVPWDRPERCVACYRLRLSATARLAAERGIPAISTTLLASTHQDHAAVRAVGEEEAARQGVAFHYEDWRPLAARGHDEAKRLSLYRQQYCGCLFSEEERFAPTALHLYRGGRGGEVRKQGDDA
ncbi:MAG: epoxyqueuosine reductase QueH [Planctomycetes bacterium]|nr:epoxyqueuosine reductase QueH [Planctomycetota bacterium]